MGDAPLQFGVTQIFFHKLLSEISKVDSQKIVKIFAIRCQHLRGKCMKFDFGWGSLDTAEFTDLFLKGEGWERTVKDVREGERRREI